MIFVIASITSQINQFGRHFHLRKTQHLPVPWFTPLFMLLYFSGVRKDPPWALSLIFLSYKMHRRCTYTFFPFAASSYNIRQCDFSAPYSFPLSQLPRLVLCVVVVSSDESPCFSDSHRTKKMYVVKIIASKFITIEDHHVNPRKFGFIASQSWFQYTDYMLSNIAATQHRCQELN